MTPETTDTAASPVRHSAIGQGVDAVTEARRLAAPGAQDAGVLGVRLVAPAELARRTLAALIRIEAQNETIIALLTEANAASRSSRGRG